MSHKNSHCPFRKFANDEVRSQHNRPDGTIPSFLRHHGLMSSFEVKARSPQIAKGTERQRCRGWQLFRNVFRLLSPLIWFYSISSYSEMRKTPVEKERVFNINLTVLDFQESKSFLCVYILPLSIYLPLCPFSCSLF